MSPLLEDERRVLLNLARQAIVEAALGRSRPEVPLTSLNLARPSGAFVTLHLRGRLRGCIGQIEALQPLAETVARCALAAAFEDPRFDPVRPEEIPQLEIEVSVLSPHEPIRPEQVEVGKHGLIVARGWQRGLLLPQVATQFHWTAQRFLEETCRKAGLASDAWKDPGTRLEAFTAEVFSEKDSPSRHAQAS